MATEIGKSVIDIESKFKVKWRWVKGYRGYYRVSNTGKVKAVKRKVRNRNGFRYARKRILIPGRIKSGHLTVYLHRNDKGGSRLVHHLVLEAFVGPCPEGMECRHFPDRDPSNNRLDNLSWGTRTENVADKKIHGTSYQGDRHHWSKLTSKKVAKIRRMWVTGKYTQWQIGLMFLISQPIISEIVNNKIWREG